MSLSLLLLCLPASLCCDSPLVFAAALLAFYLFGLRWCLLSLCCFISCCLVLLSLSVSLSSGENITALQSPWRVGAAAQQQQQQQQLQQQQQQGEEASLWPSEWWGMPLGVYIHQIRRGDIDARFHPRRRPVLDLLGFKWKETEKYLNFTWMKLLKGIKWYVIRCTYTWG